MGIRVSASQAAALVGKHERVVRRRLARGDLPGAQKDARGVWAIDVDDLASIPGWRVDPERLAALQMAEGRTPTGLLAQLQAAQTALRVERDARRALEHRMTALERVITRAAGITPEGWENLARSEGAGDSLAGMDAMVTPLDQPAGASDRQAASGDVLAHGRGLAPDARHILSDLPTPRVVALADRGAGAPLTFRYRSDAARWLVRHASPLDEASPKSWHGWRDVEMTPAGVLRFALALQRDAEVTRNHRIGWRLHVCEDPACVCHELLAE